MYMAERENAKSKKINVYTMKGDQRSKKPKFVIKLKSAKDFDKAFAEHGLKRVGSWMTTQTIGSGAGKETETVRLFPNF